MNTNSIKVNSYFLKNENVNTDISGRLYFDYVVLTIHKDANEYQGNKLCWLEENIKNNLNSAQTMPLIAQFMDESKEEPLGHGYLTRKNDKPVIYDSEQVGSVVNAEIKDVEVEGKTIRALVATGYVNEIRYPMLCQWLRATMFEGKSISTSVEIFAKKGNEQIISDYITNADGEEICIPKEFDFGGSAILTLAPADENAIVLEILNSRNDIEKNEKEDNKVTVEELQASLDAKNAELTEANIKLSALETELNELKEKECTSKEDCKCEKCLAKAEAKEAKAKCETLETEKTSLEESKTSLEAKINELTETNEELSKFKVEIENEKTIAEFEEKAKNYSDDLLEEVKDDIDDFKNEPSADKANGIINTLNARFVEKAREKADPKEKQDKAMINSLFVEVTPVAKNTKEEEIKVWE